MAQDSAGRERGPTIIGAGGCAADAVLAWLAKGEALPGRIVNGDHSREVTPYAAADAPWPSKPEFDPTGSLDTPGERWMRAPRWRGADATGGNRVGHRRRTRLGGRHCLRRTNVRIRVRLPPRAQAAGAARCCSSPNNGPRAGFASFARYEWGVARFLGPVRRYETCGDA